MDVELNRWGGKGPPHVRHISLVQDEWTFNPHPQNAFFKTLHGGQLAQIEGV